MHPLPSAILCSGSTMPCLKRLMQPRTAKSWNSFINLKAPLTISSVKAFHQEYLSVSVFKASLSVFAANLRLFREYAAVSGNWPEIISLLTPEKPKITNPPQSRCRRLRLSGRQPVAFPYESSFSAFNSSLCFSMAAFSASAFLILASASPLSLNFSLLSPSPATRKQKSRPGRETGF